MRRAVVKDLEFLRELLLRLEDGLDRNDPEQIKYRIHIIFGHTDRPGNAGERNFFQKKLVNKLLFLEVLHR